MGNPFDIAEEQLRKSPFDIAEQELNREPGAGPKSPFDVAEEQLNSEKPAVNMSKVLDPGGDRTRFLRDLGALLTSSASEVAGIFESGKLPYVVPGTSEALKKLSNRVAPENQSGPEKLLTGRAEAVTGRELIDTGSKLAGVEPSKQSPEELIQQTAARTGKVPYSAITAKVLTDAAAEQIPVTPVQVGLYALAPEAFGMAAADLPPALKDISKGIKDYLSTKEVTQTISKSTVEDFYKFGSEKLDKKTYDFMQKIPKETLVDMLRSGAKEVKINSRVPRFGGGQPFIEPVPSAEASPQPTGQPPLDPRAAAYINDRLPAIRPEEAAAAPQSAMKAATEVEAAKIKGATPEQASQIGHQVFDTESKLEVQRAQSTKAGAVANVENVPPLESPVQLAPQEAAKVTQAQIQADLPKPNNVREIPVGEIKAVPDKYQFRDTAFNEHKVMNIVNHFDPYQMTPVIVRQTPEGGFELLSGHHRLEAAKRMGLENLPAMIYNVDVPTAQMIARKSNAVAAGYTPLEEAKIFQQEIEGGKNIGQISQEYGGKSSSYIKNMLELNHLSDELKGLIRDNGLDVKMAAVLGKAVGEFDIPPEIQSEIYHKFIKVHDVTAGQMAHILNVFAPKMIEQPELFGQLQGTASRRGFLSVMNDILGQIKSAESEARAFRKVMKLIDSYRKSGQEIPQSLLKAYGDMKKIVDSRQAKIAELQKNIGQEKLPNIAKLAQSEAVAKQMSEMDSKGIASLNVPRGIEVPELTAGKASIETEAGTLIFNQDLIDPETAERPDFAAETPGTYLARESAEFKAAYRPSGVLQPYESAHEAEIAKYAQEQAPRILSEYRQKYGNFVSTDEFRDFFQPAGYNGLNSHIYHEPAAALRTVYQRSIFNEAKANGRPDVMILAGGPGAGKSTYIKNHIDPQQFGGIIDAVLADYDKATALVRQIISEGLRPRIAYVLRDPVEAWTNGVIPRMMMRNRAVPLDYHMRAHEGSLKSVLRLQQEFGDTVQFIFLENATGQGFSEVPIAEVRSKGYNYGRIKEVLKNELQRFYQEGKLTDEQYQATWPKGLGQSESTEVLSVHGSSDRNGRSEVSGELQASDPSDLNENLTASEAAGLYSAKVNAPVFYSQLQKTLQVRMPSSAPVQQVKNIIADAKKDEVEWSGINEYLDQQTGPVSKTDLIEYLKSNEIKIQEVTKGDKSSDLIRRFTQQLKDKGYEVIDAPGVYGNEGFEIQKDGVTLQDEDLPRDVRGISELLQKAMGKQGTSDTKFHQYTLPGGENYRELLLTLPTELGTSFENYLEKYHKRYPDSRATDDMIKSYWEAGHTVPEIGKSTSKIDANVFKSSHFPETNILAHVRFNERVDSDGKKVLFLEEIQSDWHQKGREKGYLLGDEKTRQAKMEEYRKQLAEKYGLAFWGKLDADEIAKYDQLNAGTAENGVPDAPFKKSWHELALKRMLRYAVDKGFDKIAWTTGEQQAERYDLGRAVDSIGVELGKNGLKTIVIDLKGDQVPSYIELDVDQNGTIDAATMADHRGKNLSDVVGKDVAKKLLEMEEGNLSGTDLKIGGQGMKGFYDQMIPSFLNKYTKKWGGRVQGTSIDLGQEAISGHPNVNDQGIVGEDTEAVPGGVMKVHSLEITPDMRLSVGEEGQALFESQLVLFPSDAEGVKISKKEMSLDQMLPALGPKTRVLLKGKQPFDESLDAGFLPEKEMPEPLLQTTVVNLLKDQGSVSLVSAKIKSPGDVAAAFHYLNRDTVESAMVIALDAKDKVLGVQHVGLGSMDHVEIGRREGIMGAYHLGAKKIILVHNHPSLSPTPSADDVKLTKIIAKQAELLGIKVKYHVVIDGEKFGLIDGKTFAVSTPDREPPKEMKASAPLVKPVKTMYPTELSPMTSPELANQMADKFFRKKDKVLAFAMDTQNNVNGVWSLPSLDQKELLPELMRIVLKNNARGVLLAVKGYGTGGYTTQFRELKTQLAAQIGVQLMDALEVRENGSYFSYTEQGRFSDAPSPYQTNSLREGAPPPPEEPAVPLETQRWLNKKRGKADLLRAEIGIKESDWLKLKIETTGENNLANMNSDQIDRLTRELQAMKKGTTTRAKTSDLEALRRRLDIPTAAYQKIRIKVLGPEAAARKLKPEEEKTLADHLKSYPVDGRGHSVLWDIPGNHGIMIDKGFAFSVGGYNDLNGYEVRFVDEARQFKIIDPSGNLKKLLYDPMQQAIYDEMEKLDMMRRKLAAVAGDIKPDSEASARIMRFGEGRATPDDMKAITEQEMHVGQHIREQYDALLDAQNVERAKRGKDPIPKHANYFTHIWEQNTWDQLLQGIQLDRAKSLSMSDYTKPNAPFNPYELARKGKLAYKDDAIGVYDRYLNTALKEIHYWRPIVTMRQYVKYLPGNAGRMVERFANDMSGKTSAMDRFGVIPEEIQNALVWLSNRATQNALVGNLNFMVTNMTNLAIPVGEIGYRALLAGQRYFLTPKGMDFVWKNSRILQSRTNIFDLDYSKLDALSKYLSGHFIEYNNVGTTFAGAYLKAMNEGKTMKEAIEYGDDVAGRTQGDYRRHAVSPYLRSKAGKIFGKLQTYPFNLMHHVWYDNLRNKDRPFGSKMGHLFLMMSAIYLVNKMTDMIRGTPAYRLDSFFPSYLPFLPSQDRPPIGFTAPIDAYKILKAGGKGAVAGTLIGVVATPGLPIVARMAVAAGGAAVGTALYSPYRDEKEKAQDAQDAAKALKEMFYLFVMPGGGMQLQRLMNGYVFAPTPEQKKKMAQASRQKSGLSVSHLVIK